MNGRTGCSNGARLNPAEVVDLDVLWFYVDMKVHEFEKEV